MSFKDKLKVVKDAIVTGDDGKLNLKAEAYESTGMKYISYRDFTIVNAGWKDRMYADLTPAYFARFCRLMDLVTLTTNVLTDRETDEDYSPTDLMKELKYTRNMYDIFIADMVSLGVLRKEPSYTSKGRKTVKYILNPNICKKARTLPKWQTDLFDDIIDKQIK